jgi:hypothetical protein
MVVLEQYASGVVALIGFNPISRDCGSPFARHP